MTLEEIIKKIIEFLKGIYRSEKFAERSISFLITYFLISLVDDEDYSVLGNIWEGITELDSRFFMRGYIDYELEQLFWILFFFPFLYLINRAIYRFIIKMFGNKDE